jgi:sulfate adenylyltransferase subunit 2
MLTHLQRLEAESIHILREAVAESERPVLLYSNWTELDVWHYIRRERIPLVPLYLAAERPVVERDGALVMVDDGRLPLRDGEVPRLRKVRFRTLGCYPLTGAVESAAGTLDAVIAHPDWAHAALRALAGGDPSAGNGPVQGT